MQLQPGAKVDYPIIADPKRELIKQLNMVDPDEKDSNGNLPSRALHIVGPDLKVKIFLRNSNSLHFCPLLCSVGLICKLGISLQIKLSFLYPATTGRNMDEVLRVVESLQKASKFKVATPANWKQGEPVVIQPGVTNEQAKEMFPQGFETKDLPSKKEYLRFTKVN